MTTVRIATLDEQQLLDLADSIEQLTDVLQAAVQRIEIANAEGDRILSAWLPGARAVLASVAHVYSPAEPTDRSPS